ncbi:MAG: hypothetical protein ACR2NM_02600 [Bythopirellula sp.]
MEWTDTLMLDSFAAVSAGDSGAALDFTRVLPLPGITLLCANVNSSDETSAALKLLRGFRTSGRRVVLCNTYPLVAGKQFGQEVVEQGGAELLVSCGISGREVGIGARDAGLNLASVVVCTKPLSGGQVLAHRLAAGDVVMMLGFDEQSSDQVAQLLIDRFSAARAVAA